MFIKVRVAKDDRVQYRYIDLNKVDVIFHMTEQLINGNMIPCNVFDIKFDGDWMRFDNTDDNYAVVALFLKQRGVNDIFKH